MKLTQRQLEFILHSNRIDWNTVYPDTLTMDIVERAAGGDTTTPQEIQDHCEAMRQMLDMVSSSRKLTIPEIVLPLHATLTKNILAADESGKWRRWGITIGGEIAPRWFMIPAYIKRLDERLERIMGDYGDGWSVHNEFECIHPFSDGNGRTGRLLLNYLSLCRGNGDAIIRYEERMTYYMSIQNYRRLYFEALPEIEAPSIPA